CEVLVVRDGLVVVRLGVGRRGGLDARRAGRDRVTADLCGLAGGVRGAADDDRDAAGDLVDRGLRDETSLVGGLREPLARGPVDQDAVDAHLEVALEERTVGVRVVAPVAVERRGTRRPVALPGDVVSVHVRPLRWSGPGGTIVGRERSFAEAACPTPYAR